jgi:DNA polymerase III delta prime subunit
MEKEIPLQEKYQPRSWDQIAGKENQKIAGRLKKIIREGKVHNFLLTGVSGCGMSTMAELIKNQTGCSDTDFIKITAANDRGLETARQIIYDSHFRPLGGKSRVVFYDGAHRLTGTPAEALLEAVQENPADSYFIFATPKPEKMPAALRDLCATFRVSPLEREEMVELLRTIIEKEGLSIGAAVVDAITMAAQGIPKRALILFEQVFGLDEKQMIETLEDVSGNRPAYEVRDVAERGIQRDGVPADELQLVYPTSHLKNFGRLQNTLGLLGNDYVLIDKACWYHLAGQASREIIRFGRVETDLRFPLAIILASGQGKLNIESGIDEIGQQMGDHIAKPTSYHPEQLVGKVIRLKTKNGAVYQQVMGHFDSDDVIFDDAIDLVKSKDSLHKECQRYLCKALDVIEKNLITKKGVDIPKEHALRYFPKCSVILFFQPFSIPEESFLSGLFRRFPIIYMPFEGGDRNPASEQRLEGACTDGHDFASYLLKVREAATHPLTFSEDFKELFIKYHALLVELGRRFGPKASNFSRMMEFTLQNWLLKMSAILTRSEKRTEVNGRHVERAFVDLLEILDSTFRFVEKKVHGELDYGESFSGATGHDRSMLQWLAQRGATSEEKSDVTIAEYIRKIQDDMKYSEAGARKRYQKHKNNRWIDSNQRQLATRVWLAFKPPQKYRDDFLGDLGDTVTLAYQEVVSKIQSGRKNIQGNRTPGHPGHPEVGMKRPSGSFHERISKY